MVHGFRPEIKQFQLKRMPSERASQEEQNGAEFQHETKYTTHRMSPFHQNFNKPKAIIQGFFLGIRKKVLRKVIHLKVNEKRN